MTSDFEIPDAGRNDDYWYNFGYGALELEIDEYAIDEGRPGTEGLEERRLTVGNLDWETLTLSGTISVPTGLDDYVFEEGVTPEQAGTLVVRAQCMKTHYRGNVSELEAPPNEGRHRFDVKLDRERVAGKVTLDPVLIRDPNPGFDPEETVYRYGQTPGLKLADGASFEVVFDQDDLGEGSFLPIELASFGDEREEQVFELDHGTPDEPILYVNSDVELLGRTMQSRAPYGPKRWIKETLRNLIAEPVWTELILWTASDISDGEPQHPWQDSVLEVLAETGFGPGEAEAIATDLEERIGDPARIPYLLEEISEVSQDIVSPRSDLENLLEEIYS